MREPMHRGFLPIALAAGLTLGAAPPSGSAVMECRLSYNQALAALARLPVLSRETIPGEDEYRHTRKFDPARIAAFGFRARASKAMKIDGISHESVAITTTLNAPYAAVRAAALASRGKRVCANTDGPSGECNFEQRIEDGWTIDFLVDDLNGQSVLTCLYSRPSA